MMTAVDVAQHRRATNDGVDVCATAGVSNAVYAADLDSTDNASGPPGVGTINIVAVIPAPLSAAAMVNMVATITEAKTQALHDHGVAGTGTASDAVCVCTTTSGTPDAFGGPRSTWGQRCANATYQAVAAGITHHPAG